MFSERPNLHSWCHCAQSLVEYTVGAWVGIVTRRVAANFALSARKTCQACSFSLMGNRDIFTIRKALISHHGQDRGVVIAESSTAINVAEIVMRKHVLSTARDFVMYGKTD